MIEGCAGGGGRYDLGSCFTVLRFGRVTTAMPWNDCQIQTGTLLGYPMSSFSNHVSACPNHQVGRNTSLAFRQSVAMFGPLGYELDLFSLSAAEKQANQRTNHFL